MSLLDRYLDRLWLVLVGLFAVIVVGTIIVGCGGPQDTTVTVPVKTSTSGLPVKPRVGPAKPPLPPGITQFDSWTFYIRDGFEWNAYRLCTDSSDGNTEVKPVPGGLIVTCYNSVSQFTGPHGYLHHPSPGGPGTR